MQKTDFQRELQELADELEPFEADLADVHRRNRHRKTMQRIVLLAAVLVLVLGVGGFVALRNDNRKRVIVTNPVKEQPIAQLHRVEYLVTPANLDVQNALEAWGLVVHYARVKGFTSVNGPPEQLHSAVCALQQGDAFAIETTKPGVDVLFALIGALRAGSGAIPIPDADARIEIVLDDDATPEQIAALRAEFQRDTTEVASFQFMPHYDAVTSLVGNDPTPRHPPAFFVYPVDGVSLEKLAQRYGDLPAVLHSGSRPGIPPTIFDETPDRWRDADSEAEIFMKPDAPPSDVDAVRTALAADAAVASAKFLSRDDAYDEFKRMFADQPALIETTSPNVLPESFRVNLHDSRQAQALADRYRIMPGVDAVVTAQAGCRTP